MNRAGALALGSLFCSLSLMIQTSLAQNKPEKLPPFPPLQQAPFPPLPPLGEPKIVRVHRDRFLFLLSESNCGPIAVRARMAGQLDSLPSRIVQINLKNTNSVAIIAERFTFHGITMRRSWPLEQAYPMALEIDGQVTVDTGREAAAR